ncbi:phosphoribosyl-AMP cyclohydrolase [Halolamina litorea]|uniref:Phosphoribosyl-AMP cyclohydrolase n=1 Tax=Halolamina litorea TaxID=1515593 RepID=A0ABD6BVX2_9EURY|nr:phosphoribosyl-AMP cyclohydrolase [Halolamina litorea]
MSDRQTIDIEFGDDGLVPAVAQDADSGEVLMLAYVSPDALQRTVDTGRAHYYSRSREELWEKGASSGHTQSVVDVRVDCDADTLLYVVEQEGGACHTGHRSCFYRSVEDAEGGETVTARNVGEKVFDPDAVYE